jgi:hypothetical protein
MCLLHPITEKLGLLVDTVFEDVTDTHVGRPRETGGNPSRMYQDAKSRNSNKFFLLGPEVMSTAYKILPKKRISQASLIISTTDSISKTELYCFVRNYDIL